MKRAFAALAVSCAVVACARPLEPPEWQRRQQKMTEIKAWLLYRKEKSADPPTVDLGLAINQRGDAQPAFGSGNCYWDEGVNRDVKDRPLIKNFKKTVGITCMMLAQPDVFNVSSAEEGGLVILDPGKDKDTLMVYLDTGLSMVKRAARAKHNYAEFGSEDRVFMLRRTNAKDCAFIDEAVTTPEPGVRDRRR